MKLTKAEKRDFCIIAFLFFVAISIYYIEYGYPEKWIMTGDYPVFSTKVINYYVLCVFSVLFGIYIKVKYEFRR